MYRVLRNFLDRTVRTGTLSVVDDDGRVHLYGDGKPPAVHIRILNRRVERRLMSDPELALGEAYAEGGLILEAGSVYDLLDLLCRQPVPAAGAAYLSWLRHIRRTGRNTPRRARDNVAHHYDLSPDMYRMMLDADMQYSCSYFMDPDASLETSQLDKKRHLAAKLVLRENQRVLDIGSGWGGLSLYLASLMDLQVTGVTLSQEQLGLSRERADAAGALRGQVSFSLTDYRDIATTYDRIVSVGMFEHVGPRDYAGFFRGLGNLLTEDGVCVVHTIGRLDGPAPTNPWIEKYIFPGGYIPALSEVMPAVERSGLFLCDVEVLRLHYAQTLREWRHRFLRNRDQVVEASGETFLRMWEFYLAASEIGFRYQKLAVFQIQLTKSLEEVPLTRDYIGQAEARYRLLEQGIATSPSVRARENGNRAVPMPS